MDKLDVMLRCLGRCLGVFATVIFTMIHIADRKYWLAVVVIAQAMFWFGVGWTCGRGG